jgi:metal-dependent amidase/aminoacylase/carboxypeptidase family protein
MAVSEEAERDGLEWKTSVGDTFPATHNDRHAVSVVRAAAAEADLPCTTPTGPMRWSEDFGWYGHRARAALVGLGAGQMHPPLHNPHYDFPDLLLEPGLRLLSAILDQILGSRR